MDRALLFDLDETLMVDEPAAEASFVATARWARERHDGIDPQGLAADARARARELWYAAPTHDYCMRVGISSWEGLWCRFEWQGDDARSLREWSPAYRRETWRLALLDQEIDDAPLAVEMGERFGEERRERHQVFPDAAPALTELRENHSLALLTNGAACLQREKLEASGLSSHFDAVVVSADLGAAKPDAYAFEYALERLGADREQAVMVGDSVSKDVDGALAAGLGAVWVNRDGSSAPEGRNHLRSISTLADLRPALEAAGRGEPPGGG
jgi:putative hydrolase of the HAD superfamily